METSSTPSRRDLLRRGSLAAAATGAVWVAPAIDSFVTEVAAASCTCAGASGIDWTTGTGISGASPSGISGYNSPGWLVGTFNGVSVRFTLSSTNTASPYFLTFCNTGCANCLTGWQQSCTNGSVSGIFGVDKTGYPVGADVTLDIDFSCDVRNLGFTILDIDSQQDADANYRDEVVVGAFRGATAIAGTYTPVSGTPSFSPTTAQSGVGPFTFTADVNNPRNSGSQRGNLTVSVPGPVSRFRMTYNSRQTSGTGSLQEVALSDLTWTCT